MKNKTIFKYTLIDTIKEDIAEYNKNEFVNVLCFEADKNNFNSNGENYGTLYYSGNFLYWGELKAINAIVKSLFRIREIKNTEV